MIQEDKSFCDVCLDGSNWTIKQRYDDLIFCDGCNVCVHQSCYGRDRLPKVNNQNEQWYCEMCLNKKTNSVKCRFCPDKTGIIFEMDFENSMGNKKTSHAHITCVNHLLGIWFSNDAKKNFVKSFKGSAVDILFQKFDPDFTECSVCDSI